MRIGGHEQGVGVGRVWRHVLEQAMRQGRSNEATLVSLNGGDGVGGRLPALICATTDVAPKSEERMSPDFGMGIASLVSRQSHKYPAHVKAVPGHGASSRRLAITAGRLPGFRFPRIEEAYIHPIERAIAIVSTELAEQESVGRLTGRDSSPSRDWIRKRLPTT